MERVSESFSLIRAVSKIKGFWVCRGEVYRRRSGDVYGIVGLDYGCEHARRRAAIQGEFVGGGSLESMYSIFGDQSAPSTTTEFWTLPILVAS